MSSRRNSYTAQVPITPEKVTFGARIEEQARRGEGQLMQNISRQLGQEAVEMKQQAEQLAYIRGQNTINESMTRLEQDYQADPEGLAVAIENYKEGFLSEVDNPQFAVRYEGTFSARGMQAVARQTKNRQSVINDQLTEQSMIGMDRLLNYDLVDSALGLTSENLAEVETSVNNLRNVYQEFNDLVNTKDANGMPLFSARQRLNMLGKAGKKILNQSVQKWAENQEDIDRAIEDFKEGKLNLALPNMETGDIEVKASNLLSEDEKSSVVDYLESIKQARQEEVRKRLEGNVLDKYMNEAQFDQYLSTTNDSPDAISKKLQEMYVENKVRQSFYRLSNNRIKARVEANRDRIKQEVPGLDYVSLDVDFTQLLEDMDAYIEGKYSSDELRIFSKNFESAENFEETTPLLKFQELVQKAELAKEIGEISNSEYKVLTHDAKAAIENGLASIEGGKGTGWIGDAIDYPVRYLEQLMERAEATSGASFSGQRIGIITEALRNTPMMVEDSGGNLVEKITEYKTTGDFGKDSEALNKAFRRAVMNQNNINYPMTDNENISYIRPPAPDPVDTDALIMDAVSVFNTTRRDLIAKYNAYLEKAPDGQSPYTFEEWISQALSNVRGG